MHAHGKNRKDDLQDERLPARRPKAPGAGPASGLMGLQGSIGNAAVVQRMRRAGVAQEEQEHLHDAGCGHGGSAQTPVQRSSVHDVLRGTGRPLDRSTRADMEARLDADFSDVRIHDDRSAKNSASEIGARAYTSGSHVVLGEGGRDKETLAHELTHVIQQRQGPVSGTDNGSGLRVSDPSDRFEREAEANARRVMNAPRPASHAGADGAVQRASARQATARTASVQRMPKAPRAKTGGKKKGSTPNAKDELIKELVQTWGWTAHGGAQNRTLHLTEAPEENQTAGLNATERIYKGSGNTRPPKDFAPARTTQSMRWISTLAKEYLGSVTSSAAEEVQVSAIGTDLYISANRNTHNAKLRELAGQHGTGKAFAKALVEHFGKPDAEAQDRFARHTGKLSDRVAEGETENGDYAEIAGMAVKVPEDVSSDDDGLHAERRLQKLEGFDPAKTVGVKRPCVVCYTQIYATPVQDGDVEVYPGPLWPSKAANKGMEDYEEESVKDYAKYLHDLVDAAGGTYITFTQQGDLTWDQNSDSDTDREGTKVGAGADAMEVDSDS
ncbi:eCIS core domain-containing protein [Streptomyces griseoluteus]|uniref:eCIS core domain-containing protein n=1 Tax=Streptomyces griseoluteus TaxID=29306 RepID=UPI003649BC6B